VINPIRAIGLLRSPLIERLITKQLLQPDGNYVFETTAFLKNWDGLFERNSLYGNASGAGTSTTQIISTLKACSEAIERYALTQFRNTKDYGLELHSSSTGFAAYPGFFSRQARVFALSEAIERWATVEWWRGRLGHDIVQGEGSNDFYVRVIQPYVNHHFFIHVFLDDKGFYRYGFGCATTEKIAKLKSKTEAFRNLRLDFSQTPIGDNEKRAKYFSCGDGAAMFAERLNCEIKSTIPMTSLCVDSEVFGGWSRYCTVWRCLLIPEDGFPDQTTSNFFLF
jgi:hypothetical protein